MVSEQSHVRLLPSSLLVCTAQRASFDTASPAFTAAWVAFSVRESRCSRRALAFCAAAASYLLVAQEKRGWRKLHVCEKQSSEQVHRAGSTRGPVKCYKGAAEWPCLSIFTRKAPSCAGCERQYLAHENAAAWIVLESVTPTLVRESPQAGSG